MTRTADLQPPLGTPHPSGSPCRVVRRVLERVNNPRLQRELSEDVEDGDKLSNPEARRIYRPMYVRGPDRDPHSRILLTSHAQYRMDLRQVSVDDLRESLNHFVREIQKAQSQQNISWLRNWERQQHRGYEYNDKKTGLFMAFKKDGKDWVLITAYWYRVPDPRPTHCPETVWLQDDSEAVRLATRVAARHIEADGIAEWTKWIVQPLNILARHRQEFVSGPVNDLLDDVFRKLAPALVEEIGEFEVDADVDEFIEGATHGRYDALQEYLKDTPQSESEDYAEGYDWGYDHHRDWSGGPLPSGIRRDVVQDAVKEFRRHLTVQVVLKALRKAWRVVSPVQTFKSIVAAVRRYGWKVGVGIAIIETLETFVLPAVLINLTGDPKFAVAGTLPLSEIVYAVAFRVLGRISKAIDKMDEDGHLDWYRDQIGYPVRLGSVDFPDYPTFLNLYQDRFRV